MASVDEWTWRFCPPCKAAGCTRPAEDEACTCKPTAWRARWRTPEGKSRSKVVTRKRDGDALVAKMESAKADRNYVDPSAGRVTFKDYAQQWADTRDWKASTRSRWPATLTWLEEAGLGDLRLRDVDGLALERARNTLGAKYSRSTVTGAMCRALAVMRSAHKDGKIGRDVTVGIKPSPKQRADDTSGRVTDDQVPTRAQALKILQAAAPEFRAAVALGLAGLRVGEVLGLTVERIDLANRQVEIVQQTDGMVISTPKCEKTRTITVPSLVAVELRRHVRDHAAEGFLFKGSGIEGTLHRETFYVKGWRPALKDAGMPRKVQVPRPAALLRVDPAGRGGALARGGRTPR